MTSDRWRQIEDLYHRALERKDSERGAFVRNACAGDDDLQQAVERLLAEEQRAESFLEEPALQGTARELAEDRAEVDDAKRTQLGPGSQLGPYRIEGLLGSGGMGAVFRAVDTRLGRTVAIKVSDEQFTARFKNEARLLASLNHRNICTLYDVGPNYLVMELVEGETLAEALKEGPLSVNLALSYGAQIADALEAAHEAGIVHRDLKPANIKVTPDGQVKVLDFGLAKAFADEVAKTNLSNSPTLSMAETNPGMILGTAAYMSPEQAKGAPVDRRTDIFALGAVMYEMLTGRAVFEGQGVPDILGAVLKSEPDWTCLPSDAPPAIQKLLRLCLQKDAKKRRQTATDVRIDIEQALAEPAATVPAATSRRGAWLGWIVAGVLALLAVVLAIPAVRYLRETKPPETPERRLDIATPATTDPYGSLALSPDGRQIVFVASGDGQSRLWLRPLDTVTAQPLAGTEGAFSPFWSPDSRSVGFIAGGRLKRINIGGGAPQTLATEAAPRGGTWNADGVILFASSGSSPLFRVTDSGGEPVAVTKLVGQFSHRFPFFLPDGRQFLFHAEGTPETEGIYLGSLESGETNRLAPADTAGVYLSPGWLLWVRAGTLTAQHLDLVRKALTGDPVTLAGPVTSNLVSGASAVSVSPSGLVAYRASGASGRELAWFDRSGRALGTMGPPDGNNTNRPSISPDGRRVAVARTLQGSDIWLLDGTRTSRFTFDAAPKRAYIWSPDGRRIVFDSARKGPTRDLYQGLSSLAGAEELLWESAQDKLPTDWSADGRFLLYLSADPQTAEDIWVLPMVGDRKPWVFLNSKFGERQAQFSPDGRWVAYMSNASGRVEIYIRPFIEPAAPGATGNAAGAAGGEWQVSTAGGLYPRWRPDGKELYYIGPNGEMMAAAITARETTLEPGAPVALFPTRIVGGGVDSNQGPQYDVTRDGRFLINTVLEYDASTITLIQNWKPPQ